MSRTSDAEALRQVTPGPKPGSGGLKGVLLRGGIGSISLKVLSTVLSLALSVVLARSLGTSGYGIYVFGISAIAFLAIPVQVGLPTLLVREVARGARVDSWGTVRGIASWADAVVLGLSIVTIAAVLAISPFWLERGSSLAETVTWALLLVPLLGLTKLREAVLQGLRRVVIGQTPGMFVLPAVLLALVSLVAVRHPDLLTPEAAMLLHVMAALVAFSWAAVLRRSSTPDLFRTSRRQFDSHRWLRSLVPLSMLHGFAVISSHTDVVMLGVLGTESDVGLYKIALAGSALVVFPLVAINAVIAPYLARVHSAGDTPGLQSLVTTASRAVLIAGIAVGVPLILFGGAIVSFVFGQEFIAAETALSILCVGQLVNAASGSVALILNMTGHERDTMMGVAWAAGINVALNAVLIPSLGTFGAATASAVSQTVWNVLLIRVVFLRLGIWSPAIGGEVLRHWRTR